MKNAKKIIAILFLVTVLSCLSLMACDKKGSEPNAPGTDPEHTHSYSEAVTKEPTCEAVGTKTFSCTCGDSYTEDIAALGHVYTPTITKYPSAKEGGTKTFSCTRSGCTHSYNEPINSLVLSLPEISKTVAPYFGNKTYTLKLDEGAKIIYTKELDDYDQEYVDGFKGFITVAIAEASIGAKGDVLQGHIKFTEYISQVPLEKAGDVDTAVEPQEADAVASVYIYLNGDDISFEYVTEDNSGKTEEADNYKITELVAKAVADMLYVDEQAVLAVINACVELEAYAPLVEGIIASIETAIDPEKLAASLEKLETFFSDDIISVETDASGNSVYSLNVNAIKTFIEERADVTVSTMIDDQYGAGTAEAFKTYVNSLPDKTLREVALSAITFAENYGVDIDMTYELIDMYIYLIADIEVDIKAEIEQRYDMTLAQLMAEASGFTYTPEFGTSVKASIAEQTEFIFSCDIDALYNIMTFGDPEFSFGGEVYSVTDDLIAFFGAYSDGSMLSITVDPNGVVIAMSVDIDGTLITYTDNGEGVYSIVMTEYGDTIFEGVLTVTDAKIEFSGDFNDYSGELANMTASFDGEKAEFTIEIEGYEVMTVDVTLDAETKALKSAVANIYDFTYYPDSLEIEGIYLMASVELSEQTFEDYSGYALKYDDGTALFEAAIAFSEDAVIGEVALENQITEKSIFELGVTVNLETVEEVTSITSITSSFRGAFDDDYTYEAQVVLSPENMSVSVEQKPPVQEDPTYLVPIAITPDRFEEMILTPLFELFPDTDDLTSPYLKITAFYGLYNKYSSKVEDYPILRKQDLYILHPDTNETEMAQLENIIKTYCPDYTFDELDRDHIETGYKKIGGSLAINVVSTDTGFDIIFDGESLGIGKPSISIAVDETGFDVTFNGESLGVGTPSLSYDYDAENGSGTVVIDPSNVDMKVIASFDSDSFDAALVDARDDVQYNGQVISLFSVKLDTNGVLESISFDTNEYTFDNNGDEIFFDDTTVALTYSDETGVKLEWETKDGETVIYGGEIAFNLTENGAVLDINVLPMMVDYTDVWVDYDELNEEPIYVGVLEYIALDLSVIFEVSETK